MYSNIIASIGGEIRNELRQRVGGNVFVFRSVDDDGEELVYCDLSVGFPDELECFPDVVKVWRSIEGEVYVTVRDSECDDRDIPISDVELSVGELALILDAIIDGSVLVE